MRAFLPSAIAILAFIVTGCATTSGEPAAHIQACHASKVGDVVDGEQCRAEHDAIQARRLQVERERRYTRSYEGVSRR